MVLIVYTIVQAIAAERTRTGVVRHVGQFDPLVLRTGVSAGVAAPSRPAPARESLAAGSPLAFDPLPEPASPLKEARPEPPSKPAPAPTPVQAPPAPGPESRAPQDARKLVVEPAAAAPDVHLAASATSASPQLSESWRADFGGRDRPAREIRRTANRSRHGASSLNLRWAMLWAAIGGGVLGILAISVWALSTFVRSLPY